MTFDITVKLKAGTFSVNWLMYKSYEFQRDHAPDIESKKWKRLYFYQEQYEEMYQKRKGNEL